jgi:hypothetical protein
MLLELCCLEEEEVFDLSILRVQAPLYRRGPGYRVSYDCPAAGFPVAAALAWVPLFSVPLPGRRLLYKVPFPLDRHIRGICPRLALNPFVERGLLSAVGEDISQLLAQLALRSKPTSSAGCRGDPWDVSRKVALPLAYSDSRPHDTSPQNWQSLMGQHGASAGSFPRRS